MIFTIITISTTVTGTTTTNSAATSIYWVLTMTTIKFSHILTHSSSQLPTEAWIITRETEASLVSSRAGDLSVSSVTPESVLLLKKAQSLQIPI